MAREENDQDDEVDDVESRSIQKPAVSTTPVWIVLTVAGIVFLLLACVITIGVVAVVVSIRNSTQHKLPGAWKARFEFAGERIDSIYTFRRDGTIREDSVDLRTGERNVGTGRWQVNDRGIDIDWDRGGFEHAAITWIDNDALQYQILNHSDLRQVGVNITLRRLK